MVYPSLLLPFEALPGAGYRREQLADWLYRRGVRSFAAMTNLPAAWRTELAQGYRLSAFEGFERFASQDGSVRYLFTLPDGRQTEAVYMPYADRKTLCISSMVGCPAACTFCATGALGFGRNLTHAEIIDQLLTVAHAEGFAPREIRNVVLMGMGEALLNYDHALAAIHTMIHPRGLAMSARRITLSTVGLPDKIRRLAQRVRCSDQRLPLVLAVSLHAPDDKTRRKIIPTAHAHSVGEILAALRDWQAAGGRRVSLEYTMLAGVNDALWQADLLATRLRGLTAHVNLIPFNPWHGSSFVGSSRTRIAQFAERLTAGGLPVSVRFSRGRDAGAACGQLALSRQEVKAASGGGDGEKRTARAWGTFHIPSGQ